MAQGLTKVKWGELKEVLLHVPIRARSAAWREAMEFVDHVLAGKNNITPNCDARTMRYSVACDNCGELIKIDEDFVFHALTAKYVHYDCHHRSTGPIGETPA